MKDGPGEEAPPGVAEGPTQGGDIRSRWPWVKPEVWTERMLEALENGVKGGCKDALRRVDALLKAGYTHVVDADIQSYFDTIGHALLLNEVEREIADGKVLELIGRYLKQQVLEDTKAWTPEAGTPQGAVISPLLANIYLHPVDVALKAAGYAMVRYADDLVILCKTEAEARQALELLEAEMRRRNLALHPEKTRLVDATLPGGFDFLGYHFERGYRWPRKKSLDKLKDTIRRHTPRTSGQSLPCIIEQLNPVLRGWFGYFKHSHFTTFDRLDAWVRMRLRSILRKWQKQTGRGRGRDHQRWPNAYFAQLGLFTLKEAHARARQSRCRPH